MEILILYRKISTFNKNSSEKIKRISRISKQIQYISFLIRAIFKDIRFKFSVIIERVKSNTALDDYISLIIFNIPFSEK